MRVENNIAALSAFRHYTANVERLRQSMSRLSSGLRIRDAGDDPAGLAISERLRMQYRNTAAAASNVENKVNYLQTADSWLQKIHDMLGRMAELAVMANDGTKGETDRGNLQREFEQMQKEIQRITSGATAAGKFNGLYLFREGTGVPSMLGDLVIGASARGGADISYVSHDGSGVTSAEWMATYDALHERWTIVNRSTGDETTLAAAPDAGASIQLQNPHGFHLVIRAPKAGTYGTGDTLMWNNTAYITPIVGVPALHNVSSNGTLTLAPAGTGASTTTGSWTADYDAAAQVWRVSRGGVHQGDVAGTPTGGASATFEGANGFVMDISAPTSGSYATGDRFAWSNRVATRGAVTLNDASSATTATASVAVAGAGTGMTSANWRARYDAVSGQWTIRNMSTGVNHAVTAGAPDAGVTVALEGANGFVLTIDAPAAGEYTTGDQFTWSNAAEQPASLGARTFTDSTVVAVGGAANAVLGDGSDITESAWRATYDAVAQQWDVHNLDTGVHHFLAAAPDAGGAIELENGGGNGFEFRVDAPTDGEYSTGDRFDWSNPAGDVDAPVFTASSTATGGASAVAAIGLGHDITSASWQAEYDAVAQEWTVANLTAGGSFVFAAAPDAGGSVDLENGGGSGFRFTAQAPTSGQYTSGDRFEWTNSGYIAPAPGSTTFSDLSPATTASAALTALGNDTGITTADWQATYDAVARQWEVENLSTGAVTTMAGAPNSGASTDLEGANGFRLTIGAPTGGQFNTGDRFLWSNTRHIPPLLGLTHTYTPAVPTGTASTSFQGDGYDVSTSTWRATYDAAVQRWTVRNMNTGVVAGQIAAAPNAGGSLADIEGANGFAVTIDAPTGGAYSTGDYFEWANTIHVAAETEGPYYDDIHTTRLRLQIGPDSNQIFVEESIDLQADNFGVIGSFVTYRYGSVNMTLLGSSHSRVRWASLICGQHVSISEQSHAQLAVDKLNVGIDHISSIRATVGAEMNRMEQTLRGLRSYEENIRATESRLRDADVAWESTRFAKYQILAQLGTAMLAQANALPGGILTLVG